MAFRTGVNLGGVIAEKDTIHGDGVNILYLFGDHLHEEI